MRVISAFMLTAYERLPYDVTLLYIVRNMRLNVTEQHTRAIVDILA